MSRFGLVLSKTYFRFHNNPLTPTLSWGGREFGGITLRSYQLTQRSGFDHGEEPPGRFFSNLPCQVCLKLRCDHARRGVRVFLCIP